MRRQHGRALRRARAPPAGACAPRAGRSRHPRQVEAEHLLDRGTAAPTAPADAWTPRRCRSLASHAEKRLHLRRRHLARMAHAMKAHEGAHPVDVGLLGAYAVVQVANALAHLIQQPLGLQRRQGGRPPRRDALFHGWRLLYKHTAYRLLSGPQAAPSRNTSQRSSASNWRKAQMCAPIRDTHALQSDIGLAPYITTRASLTVKRAQALMHRAATHQERHRSVTVQTRKQSEQECGLQDYKRSFVQR